jgi:cation diffusion facilitator family transporter
MSTVDPNDSSSATTPAASSNAVSGTVPDAASVNSPDAGDGAVGLSAAAEATEASKAAGTSEDAERSDSPSASKSKSSGGTASVLAAIAANIAVGVVKFIAAAISGSSAMLSEGIHSIVDSGNGILVLHGLRRAKKPATIEHPFGFGKELYFWTLVVAVSIFALGGGISLMEGINAVESALAGHVEHGNMVMSYIVLLAAMAIEGMSLRVAVKQFNAARGDKGVMRYIRDCKDPSLYSVLLEDTAAECGLVFALIGLTLTTVTGNAVFDGAASIVIGILLMCVSFIMLGESKGLLVGEGMTRDELLVIQTLVEADPAVREAGGVLTMYFGPDMMLITLDVTFEDNIGTDEALEAIDRIEAAITAKYPHAKRIYIEPMNIAGVERQRAIAQAMPEE